MARFFLSCLILLTLLAPHTARADTVYAAQSGSARPAGTYPFLWNSTEIRSPNMTAFTNWNGVMARFHQAETLGQGMCATAAGGSFSGGDQCEWDQWQGIIASVKNLSPMEQLRKVNDIMNSHRYVLDRVNWGMDDYWQTVFEFLRRNGDCEDYAIAKYVTLRAAGWPADNLRIIILRDTKLNLNHAVLAAYTPDGIYIGDNQVDGLVRADNIRHYRPIYSINENFWWLHRPKNS